MIPDTQILTTILNNFSDIFTNGVGMISGDAKWLLGTLMLIDLLLAILLNLTDSDHMKTLIEKTLKYGLFIFIVSDYRGLVNILLNSFEMIGIKAGGGGLSKSLISDPSNISTCGIWVTKPIFEFIDSYGKVDVLMNLHKILLAEVSGLAIMLCYFVIGIQIFITYLEFYIVATLALILIPFGVNKHTAFLGEKAIGAVLSFGIKLMVLAFIASASIPLVKSWTLPTDPTNEQIFCLLLGSLAIAFLCWHAPSVVSGLLSGSPTLTAGSAAAAALTAGVIGYQASKMGVSGIKSAGSMAGNLGHGGGSLFNAYRGGGMSGVGSLIKDKIKGGGASLNTSSGLNTAPHYKPESNSSPPGKNTT